MVRAKIADANVLRISFLVCFLVKMQTDTEGN